MSLTKESPATSDIFSKSDRSLQDYFFCTLSFVQTLLTDSASVLKHECEDIAYLSKRGLLCSNND
jgi:hypothetical protein